MARVVLGVAIAVGLALATTVLVESKVKIKTEQDKTFDFKTVRSWAWHPEGAGEVKMAITADDNPAAVKARFGPVIEESIAKGLTQALGPVATDAPQVYVYYYLLLTTNQNRQVIGQFAPSVPEWGLPPFSGATQSLKVFEEGSLLVDVTSAPAKAIVWRGFAQAEVQRGKTPAEREVRLRAAIADLFKKFPKKS
jgi:uncharacterized protein DUF4136